MKKCWRINNALDGGAPEILLYGILSDESWYGDEVTPQAFAADLRALGGRDVTVRINSPGGDVFAAQAIYNQLVSYSGKVTAQVDGVAASAAVLIVCAADVAVMPSNALLMIHNPAVGLLGSFDAEELTKYAGYLTTVKQAIINAYQKKINLDAKKVSKLMDLETWMTAQEAREYGFIDSVTGEPNIQNMAIKENLFVVNSISCDLKQFKNVDGLKRAMKGEKNVGENSESVLEKIKNLLGIQGAPQNAMGGDAAKPTAEEELQQAVALAMEKEQVRNAALDALNDNNPVIMAIINAAKQSGQTAEQVKPYIDAAKQQTGEKTPQDAALENIRKLITDNMNSGAGEVKAKGQETAEGEKEENLRMNNYLAKCINEKNGRGNDGRTQ